MLLVLINQYWTGLFASYSVKTQWGSVTHQMAVPVPCISCCFLNHHNLFYQIHNALAFKRDTCCHLVLCLQLLPFHYTKVIMPRVFVVTVVALNYICAFEVARHYAECFNLSPLCQMLISISTKISIYILPHSKLRFSPIKKLPMICFKYFI